MSRMTTREGRTQIDAAKVRAALVALWGPRPGLRYVGRRIGVPKSTLSRLWAAKGVVSISQDNYNRLCRAFGVAQSWFAPKNWGPELAELENLLIPTASGRALGAEFPDSRLQLRPGFKAWGTMPSIKGVFWLQRMDGAISKLEGSASGGDESRQRRGASRGYPLAPIAENIRQALELVAKEWGHELGQLPLKRKQEVMNAWCEVWAKTLEAATEVPRSGKPL